MGKIDDFRIKVKTLNALCYQGFLLVAEAGFEPHDLRVMSAEMLFSSVLI